VHAVETLLSGLKLLFIEKGAIILTQHPQTPSASEAS